MSAALRLEDFSHGPEGHRQSFSEDELAAEYQRGHDAAQTSARQSEAAQLAAALQRLADSADDRADIRQLAVRETLQAVVPVLHAIVDRLSATMDERLCRDITTELERLCLSGITPHCQISVGSEVFARVAEQLETLGLSQVTLEPGPKTEITFEGGRITIDPTEITARIADFLTDLSPEEEA